MTGITVGRIILQYATPRRSLNWIRCFRVVTQTLFVLVATGLGAWAGKALAPGPWYSERRVISVKQPIASTEVEQILAEARRPQYLQEACSTRWVAHRAVRVAPDDLKRMTFEFHAQYQLLSLRATARSQERAEDLARVGLASLILAMDHHQVSARIISESQSPLVLPEQPLLWPCVIGGGTVAGMVCFLLVRWRGRKAFDSIRMR